MKNGIFRNLPVQIVQKKKGEGKKEMLHLFRLLLFRSFFNLYSKNNFKYSALSKSKLDVDIRGEIARIE